MESVAGRGQMKTQDWGDVLRQMSGVLRDFRDLTMHPTNPLNSVVLTSMTRNVDGIWRPHLQGQVATVVPYLFDVTGYLYIDQVEQVDPSTGQQLPSVDVRRLLVSKHPQYEAGERVQGRLGKVVTNPNIVEMIQSVYQIPTEVSGNGATKDQATAKVKTKTTEEVSHG
jgi:hypothetical protein